MSASAAEYISQLLACRKLKTIFQNRTAATIYIVKNGDLFLRGHGLARLVSSDLFKQREEQTAVSQHNTKASFCSLCTHLFSSLSSLHLRGMSSEDCTYWRELKTKDDGEIGQCRTRERSSYCTRNSFSHSIENELLIGSLKLQQPYRKKRATGATDARNTKSHYLSLKTPRNIPYIHIWTILGTRLN